MRAWIGLPGVALGASMRSVKVSVKVGPMAPAAPVLERLSVLRGECHSKCHWKLQNRSRVWYRIGISISSESSEGMPAKCAPPSPYGWLRDQRGSNKPTLGSAPGAGASEL